MQTKTTRLNDLDWRRYALEWRPPSIQGSDDWRYAIVTDSSMLSCCFLAERDFPAPRPLGMPRRAPHPYTPALVLLGLSVLVFAAIGAATVAWLVMRAIGWSQ